MKPMFLLVKSPARKIGSFNQSKLRNNGGFDSITLSKRKYQNHIDTNSISHFYQLFHINLLVYKTQVKYDGQHREFVTYLSLLNRVIYIPAQILIALCYFFVVAGTIGSVSGYINLEKTVFPKLLVILTIFSIIFYIYLFIMKIIFQFFARKDFNKIGNEVELWLQS